MEILYTIIIHVLLARGALSGCPLLNLPALLVVVDAGGHCGGMDGAVCAPSLLCVNFLCQPCGGDFKVNCDGAVSTMRTKTENETEALAFLDTQDVSANPDESPDSSWNPDSVTSKVFGAGGHDGEAVEDPDDTADAEASQDGTKPSGEDLGVSIPSKKPASCMLHAMVAGLFIVAILAVLGSIAISARNRTIERAMEEEMSHMRILLVGPDKV